MWEALFLTVTVTEAAIIIAYIINVVKSLNVWFAFRASPQTSQEEKVRMLAAIPYVKSTQ